MAHVGAMRPDAATLLDWYDVHRRTLPWRAGPGIRPDPYRVWLSEIMLQQTTVAAVDRYYRDFIVRWSNVRSLASASLDEVLVAWRGLGYYARARNLHACARTVADRHGGCFPGTEAELRKLPGIGEYTAAAIASIAFGRPTCPVDANVERVLARVFRIERPLPAARPLIRGRARELVPAGRPGDFAQALMDLGALVCRPRRPLCAACPWSGVCAAHGAGVAESLPVKPPRKVRPVRRGIAYWTEDGSGRVLLRRRPETGLLGGMMEVPTSPWIEAGDVPDLPPMSGEWRPTGSVARHGFTHFVLELDVRVGTASGSPPDGARWVSVDALDGEALPTAMRKVADIALGAGRLLC